MRSDSQREEDPMTTLLSQHPTTDWVLTLHALNHPPAAAPKSPPCACSAGVDEEGLAILLAEIVRALLRRSPLEGSADRCEMPALSFL